MISNYIGEAGKRKSRRLITYKCEKCNDEKTAEYRLWKKRKTNLCNKCATHKHFDAPDGNPSKLYKKWTSMKTRSSGHYGNPAYEHVKLHKEWENYIVFKKWALANGYEEGLTIDRIDSSGNYEPSNCQFITLSDNSRKIKHHWTEKFMKMDLCGIHKDKYAYTLNHKGKYIGSYKTQELAINAKKDYIREHYSD